MRARLGAGDFVAKGPNPVARILFLQAVAKCVPQALTALAALDPADDSPLREWAIQWGFTDEWALRQARGHAGLWRDHPELVGRWQLFPMTMRWDPMFPAPPSWDPITEPKADYLARQTAYLNTLEHMPGLTATPEKRRVDEHFEWLALHHVGRLTYEQITERTENPEGDPHEPATISRAITDTATLVGLTLRRARGRKLR